MIRVLMTMAVGACAVAALPAHAASFDCNKAVSPDERAICRNAQLSLLDTEMGALWYSYSRIPMMMGSNGARHDEAQDFLRRRTRCGANVTCLSGLYVQRNATLRREIAAALNNVTIR